MSFIYILTPEFPELPVTEIEGAWTFVSNGPELVIYQVYNGAWEESFIVQYQPDLPNPEPLTENPNWNYYLDAESNITLRYGNHVVQTFTIEHEIVILARSEKRDTNNACAHLFCGNPANYEWMLNEQPGGLVSWEGQPMISFCELPSISQYNPTLGRTPEYYTKSICCLIEHFQFLLKMTRSQQTCSLTEIIQSEKTLQEIQCILELAKELKLALIQEQLEEPNAPNKNTTKLAACLCHYIGHKAKCISVVDINGLPPNSNQTMPFLPYYYGIYQFKGCLCRSTPQYLKSFYIAVQIDI